MSFRLSLFRRAACASAFLAVLPGWSAEPLTLAEAQRIAISRSTQLVANEASASATRRMADVAAQLPDPVLKLGVDNLPVNGPDRFSLTRDFMTMRRIGLMQELPALAKRQLRAQRVAQDAIRLQAERGLVTANLRRDTALAWLERYYALALRKLLLQQIDEARVQIEAAEASYRGGKGSQADVFAARSAVGMLEARWTPRRRAVDNLKFKLLEAVSGGRGGVLHLSVPPALSLRCHHFAAAGHSGGLYRYVLPGGERQHHVTGGIAMPSPSARR